MIYLLLNFTPLTFFCQVSIGTFKMKSQEDSKVKLEQLKKHGPLPFPEILLYWVLWISMCSYSMYSIFIASRGMASQTTVYMYVLIVPRIKWHLSQHFNITPNRLEIGITVLSL